jgi:hypothetical protein
VCWCCCVLEAQDLGSLEKLVGECGDGGRVAVLEWSWEVLGTREELGNGQDTGVDSGNGVRGRFHIGSIWEGRPVRKRGPPREAGGEGTVSPGDVLVVVFCICSKNWLTIEFI